MEQREIDNMLLSMIQKHFPSLPLSDEYTDWGKWLGFARAVYEAGRASPASAPEGTNMDKQYLSTEFDSFFEFPSDDKSQVSSISAKLFAEHIAYPIKAEVERLRDEIAALRQNNRELLDQRFDLMNKPTPQSTEDRKDAERFRDGWTHSCNALCMEIELWIDRCPHCGRPAPKAPTMQEDKP